MLDVRAQSDHESGPTRNAALDARRRAVLKCAKPPNGAVRELCRDLARTIAGRLTLPDLVVFVRREPAVAAGAGDSGRARHAREYVQAAAVGAKTGADGQVREPLVIASGEGLVGSAARAGRTVCVADLDGDPRYIVDDACRRSELCVPIVHRHEVLGVIDAEHGDASYFGDAHRTAFGVAADLVAPQLARLIEHARDAAQVGACDAFADARDVTRLAGSEMVIARETAESAGDDFERRPGDPGCAREAFDRAVAHALRHLHDARRLRTCALLRSARVRAASARGEDAVAALRRLLMDAIEAVALAPGTADQGRLLRRRFIDARQPQSLFAESLHLGQSTLRRHVQDATALLACTLWDSERRVVDRVA